MIIDESPVFTADMRELLDEMSYGKLQQYLANDPHAGDLIPGTGGLRKVRWVVPGKPPGGGVRVIYYQVVSRAQLRLEQIHAKRQHRRVDDEERDGVA